MHPETRGALHEDYARTETSVREGSMHGFGLFLATLLAVIGLLPMLREAPPRWWALGTALLLALLALLLPEWIDPLRRLFVRLGELIGRVTTPLVLGIIFYGVLTPMGLLMRLAGKDPLRLKRDPGAESYWIERENREVAPASLREQF